MNDEIIFEDYNVKFTDEDFENVDIEILKKCRERLESTLQKLYVEEN